MLSDRLRPAWTAVAAAATAAEAAEDEATIWSNPLAVAAALEVVVAAGEGFGRRWEGDHSQACESLVLAVFQCLDE